MNREWLPYLLAAVLCWAPLVNAAGHTGEHINSDVAPSDVRTGPLSPTEEKNFPKAGENVIDLIASPSPRDFYYASSFLSSNYGHFFAFDGREAPHNGMEYWLSSKDDTIDQWLMADFKRGFSLVQFRIYWSKGAGSKHFSLQCSQNKDIWHNIAANLDSTKNSVTEITLKKPVKARYIRIFQPGGVNAAQHPSRFIGIYEFQIYKERDKEENLYNLAPFARKFSRPYAGYSLKYLTDEDIDTHVLPAPTRGIPGEYWLNFDQEIKVKAISFLQKNPGGMATSYRLDFDKDEDRVFETKGKEQEGYAVGWNKVEYKNPVRTRGIKLVALEGKHGWMCSYPYISELKILSPDNPYKDRRIHEERKFTKRKLILKDDITGNFEQKLRSSILKGVWVEPWNIGINPKHKEVNFEHVEDVLKKVKDMGINHIAFLGPLAHCPGEKFCRVAWPSKVLRGIEDDSLREFIKRAHQDDIKVSIILGRNVVPDPEGKYGVSSFSYEDIGCRLSGETFKNMWKDIIKEILDLGCDGVSVIFDEGKVGAHYLNRMKDDDPCIREFKKYWGYDEPPGRREDTPKSRRYQLFSYRQFGRFYDDLTKEVKRLKPDAFTWCNIQKSCLGQDIRMKMNVCYDIIGDEADTGCWGTVVGPWCYYGKTYGIFFPAYATKVFTSTSEKNTCGTLISSGYYYRWVYEKPYPASYFIGSSIASVFNGARSLIYYRYNYLFAHWQGRELWKDLKHTSRMLDNLEYLGLTESDTPERIAVLHSRTSEDWWQLANYSEPIDSNRGYHYHQAIYDILLTEGYPFDILYLDRDDHLEKMKHYDLLIVPFPYSISDKAADKLKQLTERKRIMMFLRAKKRGVMIFGQDGPTDEYGDRREVPALKNLIDKRSSNLIYDKTNLPLMGNQPEYIEKFKDNIDHLLGKKKDWKFKKQNQDDIYFTFNRKGKDKAFILLVNYEEERSTVELGIDMPRGKYSVIGLTAGNVYRAEIEGRKDVTAEALRKFSVQLKPDQTLTLFINKN